MSNSTAFTPSQINRLALKNRLVRSATYENSATDNGEVTDVLVDLYTELAKGGVGLIITGIACVMERFHAPHKSMRIDQDKFIPGLSRITKAVHDLQNDCKIMVQLHLPGRQVLDPETIPGILSYFSPALITAMMKNAPAAPESVEPPAEPAHKVEPVAPSAIPDTMMNRTPRELSPVEIQEIIEAFSQGIRRAKAAGFDGVQLHAAHGWLLSSFLSPHTNRRTDAYGGSIANRTRIVREIIEKGRAHVGNDFPILIKMNTTDFFADGTTLEDALETARQLEKAGFDALEVSGGMWETVTRTQEEIGFTPYMLPEARTGINRKSQEGYFLPAASAIKKEVHIPVMLVGGFKSIDKIEEVLKSGNADFISLCRTLIRQPDLPRRWQAGEGPETAACISCNACMPAGDQPVSCKQEKMVDETP